MEKQDSPKYENVSDGINQTSKLFHGHVWMTDVIILGILAVTSLYIIAALIFYDLKRNEQRKKNSSLLNKEEMFTRRMKYLCIIISIATHLYQDFSLATLAVEYFVSNGNITSVVKQSLEIPCEIFPRLEVFLFVINSGLVYLFFWFRQRVFYINDSLKVLNSKFINFVSFFVLGLWIIYYVPVIIVYCVLVDYDIIIPSGCLLVKFSLYIYDGIIKSWLIVSILLQIILLLLFVNPILQRTRLTQANGSTSSRGRVLPFSSNLLRRVKKAIGLASVCLISDILSAALTLSFYRFASNTYVFYYKVNMVVNLLATIGCFDNWSYMLFPWIKQNKTNTALNRTSHSSNTSTTNRNKENNKEASHSSHSRQTVSATENI